MSVTESRCSKGCCQILRAPHIFRRFNFRHKYRKQKGGILFYNMTERSVLLVESRGTKWGPPKGTMEDCDETVEDCAIREVMEETGICVSLETLQDCPRYTINRVTYFFMETEQSLKWDTSIFDIVGNDVSAIGWIHLDCLPTLGLDLNYHCKRLLSKLFKIQIT